MNPISDLYTAIMEKVMPILKEYWQFSIMGVGLLFLLGAIFKRGPARRKQRRCRGAMWLPL